MLRLYCPGPNVTVRVGRCGDMAWPDCGEVCVECLIGKQNKPTLFKVTEPSSVPYRTPPACAKMAANPDPPPVIPVPESIAAQAAYTDHHPEGDG